MKNTSGLKPADSKRLQAALDEIPEALRDTPIEPLSASPSPLSRLLAALAVFFGISALGLAATIAWMWVSPGTSSREASAPAATSNESSDRSSRSSTDDAEASETSDATVASANVDLTEADILGHLPYEEAPLDELIPITSDGYWQMRTSAAQSFLQMQEDALADGVALSVISAFRSEEDQRFLFFDIKAQRGQVTSERAEVSAPPGYSEHHTGYAIDIGDAIEPDADLSQSFERTAAFAWLEDNAAYYSFELSFPRDNEQGIAYEPWHWRFVGDRDSLETFYRTRIDEPPTEADDASTSGKSGNKRRDTDRVRNE